MRAEKKLDAAVPMAELSKAASAAPASALAVGSVLGVAADLNNDGVINILDAYMLARALEPLGGRVKAGNATLSKAGLGSGSESRRVCR